MLIHLALSIHRFGPATLFSTDRFESFNKVMRTGAIHSNRKSPGRDLENTFNDQDLVRMLLSGNFFWDADLLIRTQSSPNVLKFFQDEHIHKMLGWNAHWDDPKESRQSREGIISLCEGNGPLKHILTFCLANRTFQISTTSCVSE